jgi:UDP-glucose 4-epimerase
VKVLVTGGAGYIGSVMVKSLLDSGHDVVVVDNLSTGVLNLVDSRAKFFEMDLVADLSVVGKVDAVIHFAAYKAVEESMDNPTKYSDNIKGLINLLDYMVKFDVKKIIFSSSAAVYSGVGVVNEEGCLKPVNYYGYTKKVGEEIISWYGRLKGINYVCLRYFNVIGDVLGYLDPLPKNVLPLILEVVNGVREELIVYGHDYDTVDGTGVRDYIDIRDLVSGHLLALNSKENLVINLGTGNGTSVLELISVVEKVSGKKVKFSFGPRRSGDVAKLVASNELAFEKLGWKPVVSLEDSVRSML